MADNANINALGVLNSDVGFDMPRAQPPRRRQPSHFENPTMGTFDQPPNYDDVYGPQDFQVFREQTDHFLEAGASPSSPSTMGGWSSMSSPKLEPGSSNFPNDLSARTIEEEQSILWENLQALNFPLETFDLHQAPGSPITSGEVNQQQPFSEISQSFLTGEPLAGYANYGNEVNVSTGSAGEQHVPIGDGAGFPSYNLSLQDLGATANFQQQFLLQNGTGLHSQILSSAAHLPRVAVPEDVDPTHVFPGHSHGNNNIKDVSDSKRDPEVMRMRLINQYRTFLEENQVLKIFGKQAKEKVATLNIVKASTARRKNEPKFFCQMKECGAGFTRKHNLQNHMKSHFGMTDLFCSKCKQGFTTPPVRQRHENNCRKASSPITELTAKSLLDNFMENA